MFCHSNLFKLMTDASFFCSRCTFAGLCGNLVCTSRVVKKVKGGVVYLEKERCAHDLSGVRV